MNITAVNMYSNYKQPSFGITTTSVQNKVESVLSADKFKILVREILDKYVRFVEEEESIVVRSDRAAVKNQVGKMCTNQWSDKVFEDCLHEAQLDYNWLVNKRMWDALPVSSLEYISDASTFNQATWRMREVMSNWINGRDVSNYERLAQQDYKNGERETCDIREYVYNMASGVGDECRASRPIPKPAPPFRTENDNPWPIKTEYGKSALGF